MTTPRRRVLRPVAAPAADPVADRRRARLQEVLAKDRQALKRWMTKLRRSFNTVERIQAKIKRLEKRLATTKS